jgi:2-polyprenyl-3-methyl-5-hydroxy-6-metoxy-1,4-benzoquinol methylase
MNMVEVLARVRRGIERLAHRNRDVDALYQVLYDEVHDLDHAREIRPSATALAFSRQWSELPQGEYLLSDPWFKDNVDRILSEQEILLDRSWFKGKTVLDAGCGNGRWAYGLSKLGVDITCVDINESALNATRAALADFSNEQRFVQTPLERLGEHTSREGYDLVFCWGVAHHCVSFNQVLDHLTTAVKPDGVLYLYLYGRESVSMHEDLKVFRERVAYNTLMDDRERERFLLRKARGDRNKVHSAHDIYAPLINRRFMFDEVERMLADRGFTQCVRTVDHPEVFVRATRTGVNLSGVSLPRHSAPYWFQGR